MIYSRLVKRETNIPSKLFVDYFWELKSGETEKQVLEVEDEEGSSNPAMFLIKYSSESIPNDYIMEVPLGSDISEMRDRNDNLSRMVNIKGELKEGIFSVGESEQILRGIISLLESEDKGEVGEASLTFIRAACQSMIKLIEAGEFSITTKSTIRLKVFEIFSIIQSINLDDYNKLVTILAEYY